MCPILCGVELDKQAEEKNYKASLKSLKEDKNNGNWSTIWDKWNILFWKQKNSGFNISSPAFETRVSTVY